MSMFLPVLSRLPLYKSLYHIGFPRIMPMSYTISLTYRCNSTCSTCFVYKRQAVELSLDEYKKIFKHLGKSPYWVTFSGGEVFLRKDFVDIVKAFYDMCKPKIINIPTNGIMVQKIVQAIQEICEHCKKSQIIVNLSIDGVGEQHDQIRNVIGNYQKVINTYRELRKLSFDNLSIGIHSVISKLNVDDFAKVANTLLQLNPDQYITEIAEERNELQTMGLDITPELINYKAAVDFLIHRIKHTTIKKRINKITQAFRIEYYMLAKSILKFKRQMIPCYAGVTSLQIAPDGDVWACCIRAKSIGNLRKHDYNLAKIWKSSLFREDRKFVKDKNCYCPLANASYTNMLLDFKTLYRVYRRCFVGRGK